MRHQKDTLLQLIQYDNTIEGYGYNCEVFPKEAVCEQCNMGVANWYPREAPAVRLSLLKESLVIPLLGVPVIHEALYELLRPHWPEVLPTRCSTHLMAKRKVGHKYWCLSVPEKYYTMALDPKGKFWQCERRLRQIHSHHCVWPNDRYVAIGKEQTDVSAFMTIQHHGLLISPALRESIEKLGLGDIGWETIPVYSERLPQNEVPK